LEIGCCYLAQAPEKQCWQALMILPTKILQ